MSKKKAKKVEIIEEKKLFESKPEPKKVKDIDLTTIFNFDIAGYTKPIMQSLKPYPTKVMRGIKNMTGRVVLMSADDFLTNSFAVTDVANEEIRNGALKVEDVNPKFALPYINITGGKGFGRGRVLLCRHWGINTVPVLLMGVTQEVIDAWLKETKIKVEKV